MKWHHLTWVPKEEEEQARWTGSPWCSIGSLYFTGRCPIPQRLWVDCWQSSLLPSSWEIWPQPKGQLCYAPPPAGFGQWLAASRQSNSVGSSVLLSFPPTQNPGEATLQVRHREPFATQLLLCPPATSPPTTHFSKGLHALHEAFTSVKPNHPTVPLPSPCGSMPLTDFSWNKLRKVGTFLSLTYLRHHLLQEAFPEPGGGPEIPPLSSHHSLYKP